MNNHGHLSNSVIRSAKVMKSILQNKPVVYFITLAFIAFYSVQTYANEALSELQQKANKLPNSEVLVLSKSYEIDGTVTFKDKSGIVIDGNGMTIRQFKANTIAVKFVNCANVTVRNLKLIGDPGSFNPAGETLGIGIFMQSCTGKHLIENSCFLDNGFTGFYGYNLTNICFSGCIFSAEQVNIRDNDNYNCGIYSSGFSNDNWEVKNCLFEKIGMGIILYANHNHLNIHHNTFNKMRGQHGIYLNASSYVDVSNNKFIDVYGVGVNMQMNNGHNEEETNVKITNNTCTVEKMSHPSQAGILVGAAKPNGPAKGIYWKNVCIANNKVMRADYGVSVNYIQDVNIFNNTLINTTYGILASNIAGGMRQNTITTTKWSGIFCNIIDGLTVDISGNIISDAVHLTAGDEYKRCCIFVSGQGTANIEDNTILEDSGHHLYGVYQAVGNSLGKFRNNNLPGPVRFNGRVFSQSNNKIKSKVSY